MERHIKLKTLNEHIVCAICSGYLIDATTVTECLHTFCKSCLVKHLKKKKTCPTCETVIHQSQPLNHISFDRTMQDIVYKLVPHLEESELKREREFYRVRGEMCPRDIPQANEDEVKKEEKAVTDTNFHRLDEQVNICLECRVANLAPLKRKYIRCSAQATITHLKKFIALKVLEGPQKYREIDILCNEEMLGKDHTLKFIQATRWRYRTPPLKLCYRPSINI